MVGLWTAQVVALLVPSTAETFDEFTWLSASSALPAAGMFAVLTLNFTPIAPLQSLVALVALPLRFSTMKE